MPGYSSPSGQGSDIGDRRSGPGRSGGGGSDSSKGGPGQTRSRVGGDISNKQKEKANKELAERGRNRGNNKKAKKSWLERKFGLVPTPSLENLEYYDPSLGWQQNVDRYRQVEKIGKYAGLPESQLGHRERIKRSKMTAAAAEAFSQKVASVNHPTLSRAYGFFSSRIPGINSQLTYDANGNLAEYGEFDGIGLGLGLLGVGGGVRSIPAQTYGVLNELGVRGPVHASVRSLSETMAQSAQTMREQQSQKNSARNSSVENKQSVFDRASQQLYPTVLDDESVSQFAIGTSFGKSKVRKAPNLSALKAKRANFGRVR